MRLWLARHGQTDWNLNRRAQGHSDIPLNDLGRAQAEGLAESLRDAPIARIIASDLGRAQETAKAVARRHGLDVETDPRLRERCFGEYEGRSFHEIHAEWGQRDQPLDVCAPGGESIHHVWERLAVVADEVRQLDEPTLLVGHGMSMSLLLGQLLKGTPHTGLAFRFHNAAFTELEPGFYGHWRILRFNVDPVLEPAGAK